MLCSVSLTRETESDSCFGISAAQAEDLLALFSLHMFDAFYIVCPKVAVWSEDLGF